MVRGDRSSGAEQFAEKLEFQCLAPKGASDFNRLAVSLKRYLIRNASFSANCEAGWGIRSTRAESAGRSARSTLEFGSGLFFAPSELARLLTWLPTARAPSTGSRQALGCILSPLRGWVVGLRASLGDPSSHLPALASIPELSPPHFGATQHYPRANFC
jgi:hypothetical protein